MTVGALRVGVDVGGTFTKAVAVVPHPFALRARAVVPTTHHHADGVTAGVAEALAQLFAELGDDAREPRRIKTVWGRGYQFNPSAWSA